MTEEEKAKGAAPAPQPEPEKKEEKKTESPELLEARKKAEELEKKLEESEKNFQAAEKNFEAADRSADEWKNKYYQVYADMANTRRQVQREGEDFKKYALQDFVKEIIPTLDAFDMAVKTPPEEEALKKYYEGFQMIHRKLLDALTRNGVEILDPKPGDPYDPNTMEAFTTVEAEKGNLVHETYVKGYRLRDHLLRAAGVIATVEKPKEEKKDETKKEEKNETETSKK